VVVLLFQTARFAIYSRKCFFGGAWNTVGARWFTLVCVSEERSGSFEELAVPLLDRLYNFAHWLTRNRDEAEDLVQETFAKALKGFGSFAPGTNFRAWMFRILKNTFLTSRTGLKASQVPLDETGEDAALPVESETPETILIDRSNQRLMQEAIEELPAAHREVLLLCEVEEMSYEEIATALSVPIGTVMSRLARARSNLRRGVESKLKKTP